MQPPFPVPTPAPVHARAGERLHATGGALPSKSLPLLPLQLAVEGQLFALPLRRQRQVPAGEVGLAEAQQRLPGGAGWRLDTEVKLDGLRVADGGHGDSPNTARSAWTAHRGADDLEVTLATCPHFWHSTSNRPVGHGWVTPRSSILPLKTAIVEIVSDTSLTSNGR